MFRLGPYELVREIAVGGMAEVHLAKVTGIGGFEKYVALKTIHPNLAENDEFVHMLIAEAKLAVQLQHSNIAQTFDLGRVGDTYYMSMEHIDGIDLHRLGLAASALGQKLPFDAIAFIGRDVAGALDYAHSRAGDDGKPLGVVHRDVSPQNVMLTFDGVVKLLDFGIAKARGQLRQTDAGIIKGKFAYMSPEQTMAIELDGRSDIYATGVVLYELLTGRPPFIENDIQNLIGLIRAGDITPPSKLRPGIPPKLEQIVMKALATYRDERYQHAGDLQNDLHGFLRVFAPRYIAASLAELMAKLLGRSLALPEPATQRELPAIKAATLEDLDGGGDTMFDQNSVLLRGIMLGDSIPPKLRAAFDFGGDDDDDAQHDFSGGPTVPENTRPSDPGDSGGFDKTELAPVRPSLTGIAPTGELPVANPLDAYTIRSQLGWSVLGTVHHATYNVGAGKTREVALKRLTPQLADDTSFVERFEKELAKVEALRHPNVVELVAHGRHLRVHYVATEMVTGTTLRKLLQRSTATPIPIVIAVIRQLLDGLIAVHGCSNHGGVTPANVLIDATGAVRLADAGIANALVGAAPLSLSKLGYVAPETATAGRVDERSDVFGVGVMMWELIAGRRLFGGRAAHEVAELRVAPPSQHNPKCDPALDRIVLAALARNPEQRTASALTMRGSMQLFGSDRIASNDEIKAWAAKGADDDWANSDRALDFVLDEDESKFIVVERDGDELKR